MTDRRFCEVGVLLTDLVIDDIDVVCPRCAHSAVVAAPREPAGSAPSGPAGPSPRGPAAGDRRGPVGPAPVLGRRLSCPSCAYSALWPLHGRSRGWGRAQEAFFQRPPWLRGRRRGHGGRALHRQAARDLRGPRRGRPPRR